MKNGRALTQIQDEAGRLPCCYLVGAWDKYVLRVQRSRATVQDLERDTEYVVRGERDDLAPGIPDGVIEDLREQLRRHQELLEGIYRSALEGMMPELVANALVGEHREPLEMTFKRMVQRHVDRRFTEVLGEFTPMDDFFLSVERRFEVAGDTGGVNIRVNARLRGTHASGADIVGEELVVYFNLDEYERELQRIRAAMLAYVQAGQAQNP